MPEACNFIKKEALAQVLSCQFCEISKNTFSYRTLSVAASTNLLLQKNNSVTNVKTNTGQTHKNLEANAARFLKFV